MWDQDWKCSGLRIKKGKAKLKPEVDEPEAEQARPAAGGSSELSRLKEKFEPVFEMAKLLYKTQPKVPGYPGESLKAKVSREAVNGAGLVAEGATGPR